MKADSRTVKVSLFLLPLLLAAPTVSAEVTFQLGVVTARPGETDVTVPISILLDSGSDSIWGWNMALRYDPEVLGNVRFEDTRGADWLDVDGHECFYDPGSMTAALNYDFRRQEPSNRILTPLNQGVVAQLRFCVLASAPSGTSLVQFVEGVDGPWISPLLGNSWWSGDAETGTNGKPTLSGGAVLVSGEPLDGAPCPADTPGPVRPPPREDWRGTYRLEGGTATCGESVAVPFFIEANVLTFSFCFSIDFDEDVLEATEVEKVYRLPDAKEWGFEQFGFDNSRRTAGNAGVDEGYLVGAAVFSFKAPMEVGIPPDTPTEVLRLHFGVRPDAPLGETSIDFVDGACFPGAPATSNELTLLNETQDAATVVAPLFVMARMNILPDGALFIRGDSNGDGKVDISDAQATLNYLFLGGGSAPRCPDAADANDDGVLNIADPVMTLWHLFLGGGPLPPPSDGPGEDLTSDFLGTCAGSGS